MFEHLVFEISFMEKDSTLEEYEYYEDFDSARADYLHMIQDKRDVYKYVVLKDRIKNIIIDKTIIEN